MTREEILIEAHELVTATRAGEYGDAHQMHVRIAAMWSALLGYPVASWQVALMMAALKLARLAHAPQHRDSWVDAAAYAAIGAELASASQEASR